MIRQTLKGKEGVVGLHDDVALVCIWENGIRLNELFRKLVVKALEEKGAKS